MSNRVIAILLLTISTPLLAEPSPWTVPGTLAVEEHEVEFTADDGAVLSGTLRVPKGARNAPAVVIPQQTRTHYRDTPMYVQTATLFNAIGFASFIYDRRGKGQSGGELPRTDYIRLALDAVAAKQAIADMDAVNANRIGFWGISQSGWISMEAADRSNAAFVVVVASPLTTPGEQMKVYTRNLVLIHGHGEEAADQAAALWHAIMDKYMRGEIDYQQAHQLLLEAEQEDWFDQIGIITADRLPEDVSGLGWLNEMDYDPTRAYESVEAPMLILHGGADWVIPVQETLDILATLEPAGEHEVHVIESANHTMIIRDKPKILTAEEAEDLDARDLNPNSEIYFMLLANWLTRLWAE